MKKIMQHPVYGEIVYEESLWTGRKTLSVNGTVLQKVSKDTYSIPLGDESTRGILKGNVLTGVCLNISGEDIWIVPKAAWLDWVLSALPFMVIMLWGNNPRLCSIFPVVGGAIGGALGGVGAVITMLFVRSKKGFVKVMTGLLIALATFAIGAVLGFVIVLAMMG
jgi:hypothetical protein